MTTLRRTLWAAALLLFATGAPRALVIQHENGTRARGEGLVHLSPKAGRVAARPDMPEHVTSESGSFRIHYTTGGMDAVNTVDADGNGVPDWPQLVAHIIDSVYARYVEWGYTNSIADGGAGGGAEYDIYLKELSPYYVYGYTYYGSDRYMEIDNDYAERIYLNAEARGLRVTLGHELFHVLQFTYYDGAEARWWQEATATFMEEALFPHINDYWQYLDPSLFQSTFFEDPSVALDSFDSAHPYGASLFPQFLTLRKPCCGMDAILQTFQEQRRQNSGHISVIVRAIEDRMDISIEDLLAEFWTWSYFTSYRSRPGYSFPDAAGFPAAPPSEMDEERWYVQDIVEQGSISGNESTNRLGAWIVSFVPDGSEGGIEIQASGSGDWAWHVALESDAGIQTLDPSDGRVEVPNWSEYDTIVLVAATGELTAGNHDLSYSAEYRATLTRPTPADVRVTLFRNQPNPFNGGTDIPFVLDVEGRLSLTVYDALGRQVRSLFVDRYFGAGPGTAHWDGTTDLGRPAATGTYLIRGTTGASSSTVRVVVAR